MNLDWKNWCRFCGKSGNNVKFESTIDIEFYFEISEKHPKICQQCSVFLKEFEIFIHKTEQSNVFFKELANQKNVDSSKINKIREIFGLDLLEINVESSESYTTVPPDLKTNVEASASGSCTVTLPELNIKDEFDVYEVPEFLTTLQNVKAETLEEETDNRKLKKDHSSEKRKYKKKKKCDTPDPVLSSEQQKEKENRESVYKIILTNCHLCKAKFPSMNLLIEHCKTQHDCSPQVPCICGQVIETYGAYARHRRKCCMALICPYKCDLCARTYANKSRIEKHMNDRHLPDKRLICQTCGREFNRRYILVLHQKVHLPPEEREKFACTQCDKTFKNKAVLRYHIRRVHDKIDERNFACHICAKAFRIKKTLENHIETHNTTLDHECDVCSRKFKSKSLLKEHKVCHTTIKKHVCEICNKTFARARGKYMHMVSHSDERPFTCPESDCGSAFKTKGQLDVHHRIKHLKKNRYICKVCGKDFYYTKDRYLHIKQSHPVEFVEFEEKYRFSGRKMS